VNPPYSAAVTDCLKLLSFTLYILILVSIAHETQYGVAGLEQKAIDSTESACRPRTPPISPVL